MDKLKEVCGRYPVLGLRTMKTVIAVGASSMVMSLLGQNPFFACIGAVVAMERTISSSVKAAVIRNVGTILGGLIGIAVASFTENIVIMALGLIPYIWISNVLGRQSSIVPGAIVYFAVFYLNSMDEAWIYGLSRIAGTLIGTLIALLVNAAVFPPKPEKKEQDEEKAAG